jgi:L-iditol 2-dehydrogenase
MKAVLFHGPKDLRYEEIEMPDLAAGELLVRVAAALTGGTDVKTYLRGHPKIIKSLPSSFGYEFAGMVAEIAPGLESLDKIKIGDRVLAANTAPCYKCFFCHKQEFSLCEHLDFLNGSFAEYIKIPAQIVRHNLYKIPEHLSFKSAACTQTLAVALHGLKRSQIKTGDFVAVLGLGAVGQTFIKLCKSYLSDIKVIAIGRSPLKLKLAKDNGADYIIGPDPSALKEIYPYGADVVIEAVGLAETWTLALEMVRPGGLVNFFGGCPKGSKIELDTFQAHYQELRTVGVFHHSPALIKEALDLISSGKINMDNLITDELPLAELPKALEMSLAGEAIKMLIRT